MKEKRKNKERRKKGKDRKKRIERERIEGKAREGKGKSREQERDYRGVSSHVIYMGRRLGEEDKGAEL